MIHKLVFDTTDAASILASSNVGAYLRASDGTLLTHTDVSGKKALDVRIAEGINVEVDLDAADDSVESWTNDGAGNAIGSTAGALHISDAGGSLTVDAVQLDIDDLDQGTDSVAVGDGTNLISLTASGEVKIVDNGNSITVDAVQLDIDDLNATDDAVSSWLKDGTGNAISSTGGSLHIADGGGSLTVDATDLDIRDLTHASDSVKIGDGTDFLAVNGDGSINVVSTQGSYTALKNVAETVGITIGAVVDGADELAARKSLWLYNNGNKTTYFGQTGITVATGFPLPPGSMAQMLAGDAMDVFMIADGAGMNVRTLQFA